MPYMKNIFKKRAQSGGFIQIIILIVIALFIMQHYGITIRGIWDWIKGLVLSVW